MDDSAEREMEICSDTTNSLDGLLQTPLPWAPTEPTRAARKHDECQVVAKPLAPAKGYYRGQKTQDNGRFCRSPRLTATGKETDECQPKSFNSSCQSVRTNSNSWLPLTVLGIGSGLTNYGLNDHTLSGHSSR